MSKSKLEAKFLGWWQILAGDLPQPEGEYKFARDIVGHGPGIRKRLREAGLQDWRFDFAWPAQKVAVEIEGGIWVRGAHIRGEHFESDARKYNAAQTSGWSVYRFTGGMLDRDPAGCIDQVIAALGGECAECEYWGKCQDDPQRLDYCPRMRLPFTDIQLAAQEGE